MNESNIVSEEVGHQNEVLESVFHSISSYARSLSARLTLNAARLLTGLTAVLAPQPHSETGKVLSSRKVGNILGLNRQAKYFTTGIANRKVYGKCVSLTSDIAIGECVTCRGCDGTVYTDQ